MMVNQMLLLPGKMVSLSVVESSVPWFVSLDS